MWLLIIPLAIWGIIVSWSELKGFYLALLGLIMILLIPVVVVYVRRSREEKREREFHQRMEPEMTRLKHERQQLEIRNRGLHQIQRALDLSEAVSHNAWRAVRALDRAETDFGERAFAPFWDSIEESANSLARVDNAIHEIADASKRYLDAARELEASLPAFVVDTSTLPDIADTAKRMCSIVRIAQRDFQFATIYEQRKTNELLVAGFGTLAWAITQLASRLDSSLSALRNTLDRNSSSTSTEETL